MLSAMCSTNGLRPITRPSDRLNIYREDPTFFQEHFANYMVLKMDFADIKMQSLREFIHSFRRMVNRLFSEHPYLLRSPKLRRSDHQKFEKYSFPRCQMSHKDLASGGRVLSQLLFKHFRKQSILLVDNVDAPAASLALCQDTSNVAHILTVISKFIAKLLRNNHQVYRALFTGVLTVADVYTREADTLDHRPVFGDARIGPYFGLTDHEVRELMVKSIRHDKLDEARRMFGGYKIKDSRESLFNTKSVTKFAADGEYSRGIKTPPYLLELKPIFEYDIFGKVIEDSLEGETPVTLRLQFKEKHLYMLKPLLDANLLRKQSKDHLLGLQYKLFQYLLEYGYYTVRDYVSNNAVRVIVPNLEMKSELKRLIYTRKFFVDKFRIEESTLADYLMAIDMLTKNRTSFETLCASVAGIFAHNMPERSFEVQGPLLAYPALCPGAFEEVYSELHSERDRPADVFIRRNDGAAIVIGLTLDGDPFESLKQIIGRGYYKERVERSRRKIYIGVNVDTNNRCLISYLWNSEDLANAENVSFTADVRSHEYGSCPSSTDRLQ
ncbi:unnamed protein product [Bemisia tabaci]|uniref:AAA-ATPase-like domain-containing protein n=1 Tax=Bemisia tabaci TaxID=7038 RepID=A0A9P0CBQ2_BEMTA|nr:unnamed protein product [Bemisia tabaci]